MVTPCPHINCNVYCSSPLKCCVETSTQTLCNNVWLLKLTLCFIGTTSKSQTETLYRTKYPLSIHMVWCHVISEVSLGTKDQSTPINHYTEGPVDLIHQHKNFPECPILSLARRSVLQEKRKVFRLLKGGAKMCSTI